ncbi:MAG: hypothetical protein IPJ40_05005 [Saprospirales bacterium]|nr:hypothetical protein [Saprospirales bacterium]
MEKGIFLQLTPGVHYLIQSYQSSQSLSIYADEKDWAYSLGLGAGIDFGLSDWITITPYGRITRLWDGNWADFGHLPFFPESASAAAPTTQPYTLWIPEAGIHLSVRWKH